MKKIKVLYFYPNTFLGPEMTVYTYIIRNLDRSRFVPYLLINKGVEGDLGVGEADGVVVREEQFGYALRYSRTAAVRSWLRLPPTLVRLSRYIRKEGIDIVQCVAGARTGMLGYLLARMAGVKLLLHYHSVPGRYAGLRRFAEYAVGKRADRAVTVSRFVASHVPETGMSADKVDVVINGANLSRFNPSVDGTQMREEYGIEPGSPLVLQLARLYQGKRQEDVVRAFAIARKQVPDLRCLIVGWEDPRYTGSYPGYKAELLDICEKEGLGSSLIIADARPEAPQLMAAADIFAMPSVDEPWGLVVTEAMSAGKPVIGADSGGIPEQVDDGVSGFLVPPKSPEAIAEKMVLLAKDAQLRKRMGEAARKRAESHFDEARLGAEFAAIYERLSGSNAPARAGHELETRSV